jgi:hypothetical protein
MMGGLILVAVFAAIYSILAVAAYRHNRKFDSKVRS